MEKHWNSGKPSHLDNAAGQCAETTQQVHLRNIWRYWSPDLNLREMLQHDFKQAVHGQNFDKEKKIEILKIEIKIGIF